jgi:hypothetical protein
MNEKEKRFHLYNKTDEKSLRSKHLLFDNRSGDSIRGHLLIIRGSKDSSSRGSKLALTLCRLDLSSILAVCTGCTTEVRTAGATARALAVVICLNLLTLSSSHDALQAEQLTDKVQAASRTAATRPNLFVVLPK